MSDISIQISYELKYIAPSFLFYLRAPFPCMQFSCDLVYDALIYN
jgi:hypothetical protein